MVPVKFKDLGKATNDLFTKGFGFGEVKVEFNSKTKEGVEISTAHTKPTTSDVISGEIEVKHNASQMQLTHKWTTGNILTETVAYDRLADGLRTEFQVSLSGTECKPCCSKVSLDYRQPSMRVTVDADVMGGSSVGASAVYDMQSLVVGVEGGYNLATGTVTKTGMAVAYSQKDLSFVLSSDLQKVCASLHQTVNNRMQAAAQISVDSSNHKSTFCILSKYTLDDNSSFKAKLSQDGTLGLGYTTRLSNAHLTLGLQLDSKKLETDAQRVGVALCFSP